MKLKVYITCIMAVIVAACANRGMGPQGGPKDETPPVMVTETPLNGAVNVHPENIQIYFNEYVQLDNVAENILMSPPQQRPPKVSAVGKKVVIAFDEELKDSTTYTIHFGSAICDYTEKNPLEDYSFSFSTGSVIDTMQIGGLMLNAEDLNPISGIIVGIHTEQPTSNLNPDSIPSDTLFTTTPFERIGKTDKEGYFSITNMKHGNFRLYGLADASSDYIYQPGEGLALYDSIITPRCHREMVTDTLWTDSIAENWIDGEKMLDTLEVIDTIMTYEATIFEPYNLLLMYFNENKQRHYFVRALREKPHYFTLLFAAPQDSLPHIQPITLDSIPTDSVPNWLQHTMWQANATKDTITLWLTDSSVIKQDTLAFEMTYLKSDSIYQLQPQTDTVRAIYRAPRISAKAKEQMEKNKKEPRIEVKTNAKSSFEIYQPFTCQFTTPVKHVITDSLQFYQMVDTVKKPLPFDFLPTDSSYMTYQVLYPWEAEQTYGFEADSAAFFDIYHSPNNALNATWKIRSLEEYSTLRIKIEPFDAQAIIQVLDEKDQVVRTLPAAAEGTLFEHLAPKSYYLRLFLDKNNDGEWTTGDYLTHRQPEPVYYFSSKLTLRANWDFEETFRYLAKPIEQQKPKELQKDASAKK